MTKMFSPRLGLSASAVVSSPVDFCIGFVVMCIVVGIYGIRQAATPLLFPALLLLAVHMVIGVGLWMSALNAIFHGVRDIVPFLINFWTVASLNGNVAGLRPRVPPHQTPAAQPLRLHVFPHSSEAPS